MGDYIVNGNEMPSDGYGRLEQLRAAAIERAIALRGMMGDEETARGTAAQSRRLTGGCWLLGRGINAVLAPVAVRAALAYLATGSWQERAAGC